MELTKHTEIARGSGYILTYNTILDTYVNFSVSRRASAPVPKYGEYVRLHMSIETSRVEVRDLFMGVLPLDEYGELLAYKKELLDCAIEFNKAIEQKIEEER